ncbi:hypothetical protein GCM10023350_47330 [Nocardioides endophyticus]|uniref:Uncharacterized protein n=1 Tax=Nocardioides endophyticus TaxID=1353775 RepID=A0ABP8ZGL9_9ACTN
MGWQDTRSERLRRRGSGCSRCGEDLIGTTRTRAPFRVVHLDRDPGDELRRRIAELCEGP